MIGIRSLPTTVRGIRGASQADNVFVAAQLNNYYGALSLRLFASKKTDATTESPRMREFRNKLRERTPIEKLEELEEGRHPYQEKEPLKPFPNNTNPETGEVGGPRGPEPTRYGDWERKGRVTDF